MFGGSEKSKAIKNLARLEFLAAKGVRLTKQIERISREMMVCNAALEASNHNFNEEELSRLEDVLRRIQFVTQIIEAVNKEVH